MVRGPALRAGNLATIMCRLSRSSVSLYLLEPHGSVQACTGLVLALLNCSVALKSTCLVSSSARSRRLKSRLRDRISNCSIAEFHPPIIFCMYSEITLFVLTLIFQFLFPVILTNEKWPVSLQCVLSWSAEKWDIFISDSVVGCSID